MLALCLLTSAPFLSGSGSMRTWAALGWVLSRAPLYAPLYECTTNLSTRLSRIKKGGSTEAKEKGKQRRKHSKDPPCVVYTSEAHLG